MQNKAWHSLKSFDVSGRSKGLAHLTKVSDLLQKYMGPFDLGSCSSTWIHINPFDQGSLLRWDTLILKQHGQGRYQRWLLTVYHNTDTLTRRSPKWPATITENLSDYMAHYYFRITWKSRGNNNVRQGERCWQRYFDKVSCPIWHFTWFPNPPELRQKVGSETATGAPCPQLPGSIS